MVKNNSKPKKKRVKTPIEILSKKQQRKQLKISKKNKKGLNKFLKQIKKGQGDNKIQFKESQCKVN